MAEEIVTIPRIIGLPPGSNSSRDNPMYNSMPVALIVPGDPKLNLSSSVFSIIDNMNELLDIVKNLGFVYPNKRGIEVAFQADNFPSDSFTNEYGESFLEGLTNKGAGSIGQLAQMTGSDSGVKTAQTLLNTLGREAPTLKPITGTMSGVAGGVQKGINNLANTGGFLGTVASGVNTALAGGRIDFPQVWKGSAFSPSYTMTVRLYNPDPASEKTTSKYIIGPLAVLLSLALPRIKNTENNAAAYMYNWPFFCKIQCPGIYFLNPCCITSVTVIKGGDQQSIAWNQRLNIVDVRIEFGSLFNTMVSGSNVSTRPTLKHYLDVLKKKKDLRPMPIGDADVGHGPIDVEEPTPNKNTAPAVEELPDTINRANAIADIQEGELNKNINQAKSFLSYAKGVVKSAKDAVAAPADMIRSAVDTVEEYVGIYRSATNIIGNVKSFDKDNIITSIYGVEQSISTFAQKVNYPDQLEDARYILGEAQNLKYQTQRVKSMALNI